MPVDTVPNMKVINEWKPPPPSEAEELVAQHIYGAIHVASVQLASYRYCLDHPVRASLEVVWYGVKKGAIQWFPFTVASCICTYLGYRKMATFADLVVVVWLASASRACRRYLWSTPDRVSQELQANITDIIATVPHEEWAGFTPNLRTLTMNQLEPLGLDQATQTGILALFHH